MTFPLIPGEIVLKDGVPFLVERVLFTATLQQIESHRDKPGLDPNKCWQEWATCPVFHTIAGEIGLTGQPLIDLSTHIVRLVPKEAR